jgi:hypothetical protein
LVSASASRWPPVIARSTVMTLVLATGLPVCRLMLAASSPAS